MRRFLISLKMTKRGCQMKVSCKYRHYFRYFQTIEGAMSYAKSMAKSLKNAHRLCENISLFIEGKYQENLLDSI